MAEAPVPARPNIHSNAFPWLKVPGSRRSAHPDMIGEGPVFSNRGAYCDIIKDRFANPDFGPCEVAVDAGISLRFTFRSSLRRETPQQSFHKFGSAGSRRACVKTPMVLKNKPAHHRDRLHPRLRRLYNFIRKFRRRFGHTRRAHAGDHA
jgi:hypothetical protein